MENMTLKINEVSKDLEFDGDGNLEMVYGNDTTAQNVRMALTAWKGDFIPVPGHGTDYRQFFSEAAGDEERKEVVCDAVFEEEGIVQMDSIEAVGKGGRQVNVSFEARVLDGGKISMEVDV